MTIREEEKELKQNTDPTNLDGWQEKSIYIDANENKTNAHTVKMLPNRIN